MHAFHFGQRQRQLLGYHHPAAGAVRRTAVLVCHSWGPEYMRSYRGLRVLAQRLGAAGYETLRFDYSGTGDSEGHSLDARLEHWLDDIATAAQELRDVSGCQDIALLGLRFGALLAHAARQQRGVRSKLNIYWDAPASGADYVREMQRLATDSDAAKRWRRNRDMQLPVPAANELFGHAWPTPLAEAVAQLPGTVGEAPSLWVADHGHPPPPNVLASSVFNTGDATRWDAVQWISTPWVPAAAANRLAAHLVQVMA